MQALRIASFMNRPTLLAVETLIMMGSYLTDCGKFIDASAIFGITVRLAQSIGRKLFNESVCSFVLVSQRS